mmetsp:Transcript_37173/g.93217  ORF Transcript_37173/g.93217 Transcript_37173/m.93217 type:complete len:222 (-) Transcript_37173:252-917(-)
MHKVRELLQCRKYFEDAQQPKHPENSEDADRLANAKHTKCVAFCTVVAHGDDQPIHADHQHVRKEPTSKVSGCDPCRAHVKYASVVEANKEGQDYIKRPKACYGPIHDGQDLNARHRKGCHGDHQNVIAHEEETQQVPTDFLRTARSHHQWLAISGTGQRVARAGRVQRGACRRQNQGRRGADPSSRDLHIGRLENVHPIRPQLQVRSECRLSLAQRRRDG